jgi:hypothetical protein
VVAQSDHLINLRQPAYVIVAIAHTVDAVRADGVRPRQGDT